MNGEIKICIVNFLRLKFDYFIPFVKKLGFPITKATKSNLNKWHCIKLKSFHMTKNNEQLLKLI